MDTSYSLFSFGSLLLGSILIIIFIVFVLKDVKQIYNSDLALLLLAILLIVAAICGFWVLKFYGIPLFIKRENSLISYGMLSLPGFFILTISTCAFLIYIFYHIQDLKILRKILAWNQQYKSFGVMILLSINCFALIVFYYSLKTIYTGYDTPLEISGVLDYDLLKGLIVFFFLVMSINYFLISHIVARPHPTPCAAHHAVQRTNQPW